MIIKTKLKNLVINFERVLFKTKSVSRLLNKYIYIFFTAITHIGTVRIEITLPARGILHLDLKYIYIYLCVSGRRVESETVLVLELELWTLAGIDWI
jgi:hypothetical protein